MAAARRVASDATVSTRVSLRPTFGPETSSPSRASTHSRSTSPGPAPKADATMSCPPRASSRVTSSAWRSRRRTSRSVRCLDHEVHAPEADVVGRFPRHGHVLVELDDGVLGRVEERDPRRLVDDHPHRARHGILESLALLVVDREAEAPVVAHHEASDEGAVVAHAELHGALADLEHAARGGHATLHRQLHARAPRGFDARHVVQGGGRLTEVAGIDQARVDVGDDGRDANAALVGLAGVGEGEGARRRALGLGQEQRAEEERDRAEDRGGMAYPAPRHHPRDGDRAKLGRDARPMCGDELGRALERVWVGGELHRGAGGGGEEGTARVAHVVQESGRPRSTEAADALERPEERAHPRGETDPPAQDGHRKGDHGPYHQRHQPEGEGERASEGHEAPAPIEEAGAEAEPPEVGLDALGGGHDASNVEHLRVDCPRPMGPIYSASRWGPDRPEQTDFLP